MCWHALVFQTLDLLIKPVEYIGRIVSRDDVWLNRVGAQVLCKSDMTPINRLRRQRWAHALYWVIVSGAVHI